MNQTPPTPAQTVRAKHTDPTAYLLETLRAYGVSQHVSDATIGAFVKKFGRRPA
jgi:hypothetical protein